MNDYTIIERITQQSAVYNTLDMILKYISIFIYSMFCLSVNFIICTIFLFNHAISSTPIPLYFAPHCSGGDRIILS